MRYTIWQVITICYSLAHTANSKSLKGYATLGASVNLSVLLWHVTTIVPSGDTFEAYKARMTDGKTRYGPKAGESFIAIHEFGMGHRRPVERPVDFP